LKKLTDKDEEEQKSGIASKLAAELERLQEAANFERSFKGRLAALWQSISIWRSKWKHSFHI
jgi:hypothetical protein